jgi:hypothetical protein
LDWPPCGAPCSLTLQVRRVLVPMAGRATTAGGRTLCGGASHGATPPPTSATRGVFGARDWSQKSHPTTYVCNPWCALVQGIGTKNPIPLPTCATRGVLWSKGFEPKLKMDVSRRLHVGFLLSEEIPASVLCPSSLEPGRSKPGFLT